MSENLLFIDELAFDIIVFFSVSFSYGGAMEFDIGFTDKDITAWGGMALMKKMLDRSKVDDLFASMAELPRPQSNRGYDPEQIIKSFWVSIWCGANRFLHTEVVRQDEVIRKIFGWDRMCGHDTYRRFFGKFTLGTSQEVSDKMYSWFFNGLKFDNYTLDFDSTVITRYGDQEGAARGYNPAKRNRKSHHPLMAFVADCRMVANFWLRSGNASSANNMESFLDNTLYKLGEKKIGLLRADSGFCSDKIFTNLEKKSIQYVIAARFQQPIQRLAAACQCWFSLDDGIEVSETSYQGKEWEEPRRMILVRQHIPQRPKASGKQLRLFSDDEIYNNYRYQCFITNLALPAAEVWRLYRGRADAENRIKELKYDFGLSGFSQGNFVATEAALNMVMMAYNLMSLFRQVILKQKKQPQMSTLRYTVFAVGAFMVKEGNKRILKLSMSMKRREWFEGLWSRASAFSW